MSKANGRAMCHAAAPQLNTFDAISCVWDGSELPDWVLGKTALNAAYTKPHCIRCVTLTVSHSLSATVRICGMSVL